MAALAETREHHATQQETNRLCKRGWREQRRKKCGKWATINLSDRTVMAALGNGSFPCVPFRNPNRLKLTALKHKMFAQYDTLHQMIPVGRSPPREHTPVCILLSACIYCNMFPNGVEQHSSEDRGRTVTLYRGFLRTGNNGTHFLTLPNKMFNH